MQWTLHSLISLLCVASLSAKRLSRHVALAEFEASSDRSNDRNGRNGSDGNGGEVGHPCLQEEPLKAVMKGLGVKDKELQHVRDHPWTRWKDCRVVQLDIPVDVQGSLDERIRELVDLQLVVLFGSNFIGDVALLKENTELKVVIMRGSSVFGDLQSLSALRKLERLDLSGTKVYGDLKSLSMEFQVLDLSKTKVSGDLKTLKTAKLENLHLQGTQVTGDLASLATATQMILLHLSDTEISGHLASLSNLTGLYLLNLARTKVIGDLSVISAWQELQLLDLSDTQITGEFTKDWSKSRDIRSLNLARTKVRILDTSWLQNITPSDWADRVCPFPKLKSLDISGTPLFCTVDEFLGSFSGCSALRSLKAEGCGLTGPMDTGTSTLGHWDEWPLAKVLRRLDLSSNNVTEVNGFPPSCRSVILAGNPAIALRTHVLERAMESITSLDLRNMTFNPSDVADLLESGVVKKTAKPTVYNEEHGFACYGNTNVLLLVSPEQFAPDQLCSCFPGWKGSGAQCQKCPQDSFTENYSSSECQKCPPGSKAPAGATSRSSCVCDVGVLYSSKGSWKCGCPEHEALLEGICVRCEERGLDCSLPGSDVLSARPLPGFTRLYKETRAFKCLAPDMRCNPNSANLDVYQGYDPSCAEGYIGVMCMECAPKYFATKSRCRRCQNAIASRNGALMILGSLILGLVAIGVGIWLWIRRMRSQKGPGPLIALREQLKVQAPILLQLCQLWGVLALLATVKKDDPGISVGGLAGLRERLSTFWEVPYVEVLQLSISSFKDMFNLQCRFDGGMVRFVFALAAPVVPLVILLCCVVLELMKPGSGINVGLKALTLFYVGGASSTARLLSCQETDGAGDSLPRQFAFRTLMPYVSCHEESALKRYVDLVAFSCAFFWAIVIPCCLLHVYRRQHIILQASRTTVALATDEGSLKVSVSEVLGSNIQKEFVRRLVAAAAAYIAVLYRGRVQVQIVRGTATVKQLDARDSDAENVADFSNFFSFSGRVDTQQRAKQLKCRDITNMLTERAILDALARDRVLVGAKSVLHKYSSCRNIWMEILQKLVVMALISIVATEGYVLSITVTLTMAATSSMVQPYAQPQVNTLHRCCFLCLAVSAISFSHGWVWPCRAALVFPFLLTTAQALRPDSPEGLAVRLWQELEPQIEALQHGEAIEVMAEIYSFI